jgi:hypothetical protein
VHELGDVRTDIFRWNVDLWNEYEVYISHETQGFSIKNAHRCCGSSSVSKVWWRKPFQESIATIDECESAFIEAELRDITYAIMSWSIRHGKAVLVNPFRFHALSKIEQCLIGQEYFDVPRWSVGWNRDAREYQHLGERQVVKSLSSATVAHGHVLYTTVVASDGLDPRYPWFRQQLIDPKTDITVAFIGGSMFAFALRGTVQTDWRSSIAVLPEDAWSPIEILVDMRVRILAFMKQCGLSYGRLDFVRDAVGRWWFLEVNPNGQFAWLDMRREHGLLDAVIAAIDPAMPMMDGVVVDAFRRKV